MNCTLCSGQYREKTIVLSFQRNGRSVVVEGIPALVCDLCGDSLFTMSALNGIERLLEQEPQDSAPLYRFPEKTARTA